MNKMFFFRVKYCLVWFNLLKNKWIFFGVNECFLGWKVVIDELEICFVGFLKLYFLEIVYL